MNDEVFSVVCPPPSFCCVVSLLLVFRLLSSPPCSLFLSFLSSCSSLSPSFFLPWGREQGSVVGFRVWTRPMGSGAPVPPPRQYPSNFPWSQQGQGTGALPEVPLSQQSMMVPPGQPGLSQQSLDLSQPSATPLPSWQPSKAPMATPRHTVQGCGFAGIKTHLHHPGCLHNLLLVILFPKHLLQVAELFQQNS